MSFPVTQHFMIDEFACHDGTPYPVDQPDDEAPGSAWLQSRLHPLCETLELIREAAGGGSITVDSGFRTMAYDQRLYDNSAKDSLIALPSRSQHPKGRAADITHATLKPHEMFNLVQQMFLEGKLPKLGGVGLYPTFIHVDVRPRGVSDHLAIWGGSRLSNVA